MRIRSITAFLAAFFAFAAGAEAADAPDFGPAVQISPPLPHPFYSDPDVALRDGRTVAVWTKARTGTKSFVQATELDDAGQPGPVSSILASPDSGFTNDPVVTVSSSGTAAVAWDGGPDFLGVEARLAVLDTHLAAGPTQTLGKGYDPAARYPAGDGNGLLAWSSAGGVSLAPIDSSGVVGATNTIPVGAGTFAADPTIELSRDGGTVYWVTTFGVFAADVGASGGPGPVREVLPEVMSPTEDAYRNLVVSGDLLVALQPRGDRQRLICAPLGGGSPKRIDSGPRFDEGGIRVGSVDLDTAGSLGLIGWVRRSPDSGAWVARAATVDRRCRVSRTSRLPSPGRRAYDTEVGHDGRSPLALVAGGGGLEAVDLSRSGKVRGSRRIAKTKPVSKKLEARTPVTDLELVTEPGSSPTAVWAQSHRGPGQTIAASIAR